MHKVMHVECTPWRTEELCPHKQLGVTGKAGKDTLNLQKKKKKDPETLRQSTSFAFLLGEFNDFQQFTSHSCAQFPYG